MPAPVPDVATPDPTLCGRCGGALAAGGAGAMTCRDCLGDDLVRDLDQWFAFTSPPPAHGLRVSGGFTLLEQIGHGGMGQVFRARQESPERDVAIKLLMPHLSGSEETRQRFLAEAEAMAELEHPGLLPLYACGETDGRPWLVTRLAGGGNLSQRRERYAGQWREIAELMARLADAIQHAHARGIIHRDLKPSNVLFDSEDNACIADFGLAKWRDENVAGQTLSHVMMGTPAYMAPELARHGARVATTAVDVYGLGAILYELLTGRRPHTGESPAEILFSVTSAEPPRPRSLQPHVPRDLEVICLRAMAREPAGRYETAASLAADLRRFVAGETVSARPYSLPERMVRWARRRPLAASLTGVLAVVLAVGAVVIVAKNAELRRTITGWQASADSAEARVAYAVDTLPDKLAPLGKLALLDDLFADVAEHYQRAREVPVNDRNAAEVREAAFLVKWGRVLRPQGRIAEAEEKFVEAQLVASRVTGRPDSPAKAWAALAQARQSLGLLALTKGRKEQAQLLLADAVATADDGLKRFPAHQELLVARAEAITESCAARIAGAGGEPAALDELETAWRAAVAGGEKTAAPAEQQEHLRNLAKVSYYRGLAAEERGTWPAAEKHYQTLLVEHERLALLPAAGNEDQRNIAIACNRLFLAMYGGKPEPQTGERHTAMMNLLERERNLMDSLLKSDPSNLRWKANAALMRYQEAWPVINANEHEKAIPLLKEAAEMIREIPDEVSSTLEEGRGNILNALARQLTFRAGKLSHAVKSAAQAEVIAARRAACEAADATFAAALDAFPHARNWIPHKVIEQSWGIWQRHGPPGYARHQLERALLDRSATPGLAEFLQSQLMKLNSTAAPLPGSPNQKPDPAAK